jgi:hypothetical protein
VRDKRGERKGKKSGSRERGRREERRNCTIPHKNIYWAMFGPVEM